MFFKKNIHSKLILTIVTFFLISSCITIPSLASNENPLAKTFYTYGDADIKDTRINPQNINGENYFIMPSNATPENVNVYTDIDNASELFLLGAKDATPFYSGINIDLTKYCKENNYKIDFIKLDLNMTLVFSVTFIFSKNIPALYLSSDKPLSNGRNWVESASDKSNKATGKMVLQKENGDLIYNGVLTQIKGRGNSTWNMEKKPYQIKTKSSVDLLETSTENKSKTWILLANYMDSSLLRNTLALNIGNSLGMKTNIENKFVDLYYDGEYRGNYLLTEKVEVGKGRVNIKNLDDENTIANNKSTLADFPTKTGTTSNGATYTYCDKMKSPENISGGYLLEMDYQERALDEICYFCTLRGQYIVVKSPEYASKEEMDYIASLYQEYEDAVYSGGVNPSTGKSYSDYVDARSIACYYLVNEFSKARDIFSSSAYLYKDADDDKMYMGPLWDYDLSFGKSNYEFEGDEPPEGMTPYITEFGTKLLNIKDFVNLVGNIYLNEFYPIIKETVLSEEQKSDEETVLQSLTTVSNSIESSAKINCKIWHPQTNWNTEVEALKDFITLRAEELKAIFYLNLTENQFLDVLPYSWFYQDVITASKLGYMTGIENSYFYPDLGVRYAEVIKVLHNMTALTESLSEKQINKDESTPWYRDAVEWAIKSDIIIDSTDGLFQPEEHITRENLALYLYRFENSPTTNSELLESFDDKDLVSANTKNAVEWAVNQNILKGHDNNLYPQKNLTRAELAAILVRYNQNKIN